MTPIEQFLAAATEEIGVEEQPRGSNSGPRVDQYLAVTGLSGGCFWCAAFVAWCGKQAARLGGWTWPVPPSADCDVLLDWARRRGVLKTSPQAGDVFLVLAKPDDAIHTGIVVSVRADGSLETIEGNSNNDGSSNGYKVAHRERHASAALRYVRWVDLLPSSVLGGDQWQIVVSGQKIGPPLMQNGRAWYPARAFLLHFFAPPEVAGKLTYDAANNALLWNGHTLAAPVTMREGSAWCPVRELAAAFGLTATPDAEKRTITIAREG